MIDEVGSGTDEADAVKTNIDEELKQERSKDDIVESQEKGTIKASDDEPKSSKL